MISQKISKYLFHLPYVLRLWILCVGLLFFASYANGQDPHFSQYYASPIYMNPAFSGSGGQNRIVLNHRLQWPTLPQAYSTYALSYDFAKPTLRSGFGLLFSTDKAGATNLRATNVGAIYSYKLVMPNKWVITPALYFGYGSRSLGYNEIVFGDQLEFGNSPIPTYDPTAAEIQNKSYFDGGSGILLYNKTTWIGASWWHINRPNISFLSREERIPSKFTIHAGTQIIIDKSWANRNNQSYLTISGIYSKQGPFQQMDIGVNYHIDPIIMGVSYRGIPFRETYIGSWSRDAVVFSTGLRFNQFNFMYSYDFTVSELSVRSEGAHEISLEYRFDPPVNPKKVPRSMKILPCPNYIPYQSYKTKRRG